MGIFDLLRGTMENLFQIGKDGPNVKNNAGVLEARNTADSAYAKLRADHPGTNDNDVATKKFVETINGFVVVSEQADTSSSIPANTGVKRNLVVSTPGTGAVIGDLLFDDGSSSGLMEIIIASERAIAVTKSLTGGTVTFDPDSIYLWDVQGASWVKIGDIGSVVGANRVLRYPIALGATQDSTATIPANSIITHSRLIVNTPYSGGTTIEIGQAGDTDLIQATTENNPPKGNAPNMFKKDQDTAWGGSALAVRTTLPGGAAAAGAGFVVVFHTVPQA